jgi:tRNA A37 threonylcarbamoyladenosine biosynthesis protein TsaE
MRYALINSNNEVENIVIWDGVTEVEWPEGLTAVIATQEHEAQYASKNISVQNEQAPLTEAELELLRNLLARA